MHARYCSIRRLFSAQLGGVTEFHLLVLKRIEGVDEMLLLCNSEREVQSVSPSSRLVQRVTNLALLSVEMHRSRLFALL